MSRSEEQGPIVRPYVRKHVGAARWPANGAPATHHRMPHLPHLPRRPGWKCRVCGDMDWPCPSARMLLGIEYRRNLAALGVYMAQQLTQAAEDLRRLTPANPPDGNVMYDRFMLWVRRKGPLGPDHPNLENGPEKGPERP
ncbi:hypothetical protein ACNAW0_06040 [Micromonospora sp. SL1-18]|uniref:hypothetical protein n=1 Tax=Micromonospora sp. SL1-18 TaxID=3399128 RepID=UPI003A4DDF02